jgi:hypothetical protein
LQPEPTLRTPHVKIETFPAEKVDVFLKALV